MYDTALVDDLAWLGFVPDSGPVRQSDADAAAAYAAAADELAAQGLTYRCACTRTTFAVWARDHGRAWTGAGCPGACRSRALPGDAGASLRVDLGDGEERFEDLLLGAWSGRVAASGDPVIRDRAGNWTYPFAVVVDDFRQGVDLIVRGDDLLDETPRQIRLARILGRPTPPRVLHHPVIRKATGAKLSKSDGDSGIGDIRRAGRSRTDVVEEAIRRGAIPRDIAVVGRPARRP